MTDLFLSIQLNAGDGMTPSGLEPFESIGALVISWNAVVAVESSLLFVFCDMVEN